jgi:hypothetical protein
VLCADATPHAATIANAVAPINLADNMLYFLLTVSDSVCEQGPMLTAQRQENNVKAYDGD